MFVNLQAIRMTAGFIMLPWVPIEDILWFGNLCFCFLSYWSTTMPNWKVFECMPLFQGDSLLKHVDCNFNWLISSVHVIFMDATAPSSPGMLIIFAIPSEHILMVLQSLRHCSSYRCINNDKSILMVMPTQCHCDCWCCSSYWVHTGLYYFQQRGSIISNDFDVWIKPDKQIKWTYVILVQTMEFPLWLFWYQRYWHLILHLVRFD